MLHAAEEKEPITAKCFLYLYIIISLLEDEIKMHIVKS